MTEAEKTFRAGYAAGAKAMLDEVAIFISPSRRLEAEQWAVDLTDWEPSHPTPPPPPSEWSSQGSV